MPELAKKEKPKLGRALAIVQTIISVTCSLSVIFVRLRIGITSPLPIFVGALAYTLILFLIAVYSLWRHMAWADDALFGFMAWFLNLSVIIGTIFDFDLASTLGMVILFGAIVYLVIFVYPPTRAVMLAQWKGWRRSRYRCKECGTRIPEGERSEYERNEGYCYSCYWDEDGPGWKKPISSPSGARAAFLRDTAHEDRLRYELKKYYMHYICPKCTRPISIDSLSGSPRCPDCGTQLWWECENCEAEIAICDELCWYCGTKNPNYDSRSRSK